MAINIPVFALNYGEKKKNISNENYIQYCTIETAVQSYQAFYCLSLVYNMAIKQELYFIM